MNHKTELYTQKKYDNFETIDEDDSSRRGSSKRGKDRKKPFSDEATGGDATETESTAPAAKRKVQLSRDIVTVNLHMDTSPIYTILGVQYIPFMARDLDMFFDILASINSPAESLLLVAEKSIDNTNIKEFLEYESNSESSKNVDRVECGKLIDIYILSYYIQKLIYF